jgi:endogenous inhibitor of DNA gyrase (YacG/DUF329 family)
MADLGKWLSGEYRVAGRAAGDPEDGTLAAGADDPDQAQ